MLGFGSAIKRWLSTGRISDLTTVFLPIAVKFLLFHCLKSPFIFFRYFSEKVDSGQICMVCLRHALNTTEATSGAATAYPFGVSEFTPGFKWGFVLLDL